MNIYTKIILIIGCVYLFHIIFKKKDNFENENGNAIEEAEEVKELEQLKEETTFELTKEQKADKLTKDYFDMENILLDKIKASKDKNERKILTAQIDELYTKLKSDIEKI